MNKPGTIELPWCCCNRGLLIINYLDTPADKTTFHMWIRFVSVFFYCHFVTSCLAIQSWLEIPIRSKSGLSSYVTQNIDVCQTIFGYEYVWKTSINRECPINLFHFITPVLLRNNIISVLAFKMFRPSLKQRSYMDRKWKLILKVKQQFVYHQCVTRDTTSDVEITHSCSQQKPKRPCKKETFWTECYIWILTELCTVYIILPNFQTYTDC